MENQLNSCYTHGFGYRCAISLNWWQLLEILVFTLITTITHGDPQNLVLNGNFEKQIFSFGVPVFPSQDVLHIGKMSYIPYFQVVIGGVQILDASEYVSAHGGNFILHMNFWYGGGVIQTVPLITPRKGATYNMTFDMANNPDGGRLTKSVKVMVLINNRKSSPDLEPFNVSSPQSQRNAIIWKRMSFTFVGTGESTKLQFESLEEGSFGALIDNIKVMLVSLVDNGSFEKSSLSTSVKLYSVLTSPSYVINSWIVTAGKIKLGKVSLWQSSTDGSKFMLDLNDDPSNPITGLISSIPFHTKPGIKFQLLFDTTANPQTYPSLKGAIYSTVISMPSGKVLASKVTRVNGDGFSTRSMGWQTQVVDFEAEESKTYVEFMSKIGGSNGPMLDNVLVYEVTSLGEYRSVPITFNMGLSLKSSTYNKILLPLLIFSCLNY